MMKRFCRVLQILSRSSRVAVQQVLHATDKNHHLLQISIDNAARCSYKGDGKSSFA